LVTSWEERDTIEVGRDLRQLGRHRQGRLGRGLEPEPNGLRGEVDDEGCLAHLPLKGTP